MTHPYAAVLQPGTLGTLNLRNRIVMAPMGSNFAETDGHCGERIQAYYEARARGGAGLLIMGVCAIAYPSGTAEPYQVGLSRDEFLPGLKALAERVHRHGARIGAQLQHAGKTATRDMAEGRELWVPSMPPQHKSDMLEAFTPEELASFVGGLGRSRPRLREMDEQDIGTMIGWFADAAARAQVAGFDMVEVHAAHTYILAGFLSPHFNRRTDRWGGPLENRARLMVEVIRAIKARCGAGFPVSVRLDGEELRTEGGITLSDCVGAARLAVQAGADAIHASAYATITSGTAFTEAPLPQTPRAFVPYAQAVKAAVAVPVIAVGRIEAEEAAADIAGGRYDFIAMARKMLADPAIPIKLAENRPQDIRPCIYCYACVSQIFINQRVKCAVNAETGHEHDGLPQPADAARHVVVVGGGPAGMEAARVAAQRGHRVTLLERSDRLGGTLFFAALAYPENGRLLDHLVAQMSHPGIAVKLATQATPELVAALQPDHLVVATGARRAAPTIPGAEQRHVWSGDELRRLMTGDGADEIARAKLSLAERALFKAGGMLKVTDSRQALRGLSKLWMPLGQRVVIVGGGLVGLELAEFLLARGRHVTVLEPGVKAGRELSIVRRWRVLDAVRSHGALHVQAEVQRIAERSVHWRDGQGQAHTCDADSVVLALGAEPDDGPMRSLAGLGLPTTLIGDGASLGYIEGAIHQGYRAGAAI